MILNFIVGTAIVRVDINGKVVKLSGPNLGTGNFILMENLILSGGTAGILKEFPQLKHLQPHEMKNEAIKLFRKKLESFKNEEEIKQYVIEEMKKQGGKLLQ